MKILAFVFALVSSLAMAQTTTSTSGPCSPIAPNNSGSITIECPGMSEEQARKMVAILNKIVANQLDPAAVMAKLDEIGKDVKTLKAGIYSGYDFNGAKRERRPGVDSVTAGPEIVVFQQMIKLHHDHNWGELLKVAEDEIKTSPEWLTPYLFSGIANANLGNRDAAIQRLTYVRDEAAGNPDYADADRILRLLQN